MEIIKTKRFTLRPFKQNDLLSLYNNVNNKKVVFNLSSIPWPVTLKDEKEWLKKIICEQNKKDRKDMIWVIDIGGEAVGTVGFHKIVKGHKAEIGYWLAEKLWGQGIMTNAVKLVTQYGFNKLKLLRIEGFVFSHNLGSKRVLEKAGFKQEAFLKKYIKAHGKVMDAYMLAKIKK